MVPALRLLRPHQWTKNLLVWAPFLFTASWSSEMRAQWVAVTFASFCLVSSAVYVFNDLADAERDRKHPKKMHRPIAAGQIKPNVAGALGVVLLVVGVGLAAWVNWGTLLCIAAYLVVQLAYNLWLKHEPVADVFAVGTGFVLRAIAGAVAIGVAVSGWLFACTAMVALFLGFAKRRGELVNLGEAGTREVLQKYSRVFLDHAVTVTATATLVSYALYVIASDTAARHTDLVLTLPIVAFALLRYMYLTFSKGEGGEPDVLLFRDPQMAVSLGLYVLVAIYAMTQPGSIRLQPL